MFSERYSIFKAAVLEASSVLYTINHQQHVTTIVMCFKVLLICELFSINVSQTFEEGQRTQSLRVFDLDISSDCLDQAHETLQLWCNIIWRKRERETLWEGRQTDREKEIWHWSNTNQIPKDTQCLHKLITSSVWVIHGWQQLPHIKLLRALYMSIIVSPQENKNNQGHPVFDQLFH